MNKTIKEKYKELPPRLRGEVGQACITEFSCTRATFQKKVAGALAFTTPEWDFFTKEVEKRIDLLQQQSIPTE